MAKKGYKSEKRINAIQKMVESIITGNADEAEDHLHAYLQTLSREIILGEGDDEEMVARDNDADDDEDLDDEDADAESDDDEDVDPDAEDDDDEDVDPDAEDEDMDEGFAQPTEGAMKRKMGKFPTGGKRKSGIEKHGNSSKHLDDKIKGKAKYQRYPKGKPAEKHANVKDGYAEKCDGRDKNLGTTD